MSAELVLVVAVITLALCFDFVNGFHDAANSVATVVATRVLTPLQAVVWAAFFNFISAISFGTAVAATVGVGLVDLRAVTVYVILSGIIGAIVWDLLTWWWGLPDGKRLNWQRFPCLKRCSGTLQGIFRGSFR